MIFLVRGFAAMNPCRGVAKLVKASDFDSDMRGFESFLPCQIPFLPVQGFFRPIRETLSPSAGRLSSSMATAIRPGPDGLHE